MTAAEYLKKNSDWFYKSPGGENLYFESEVIKMMEKYSSQQEISDEEIYKESFKKESPIWHEGFVEGYNKAKETLYTEEDLKILIGKIRSALPEHNYNHYSIDYNGIIKSLKQK
jgi:hypothetical protein